jgi:hypothetical protein
MKTTLCYQPVQILRGLTLHKASANCVLSAELLLPCVPSALERAQLRAGLRVGPRRVALRDVGPLPGGHLPDDHRPEGDRPEDLLSAGLTSRTCP